MASKDPGGGIKDALKWMEGVAGRAATEAERVTQSAEKLASELLESEAAKKAKETGGALLDKAIDLAKTEALPRLESAAEEAKKRAAALRESEPVKKVEGAAERAAREVESSPIFEKARSAAENAARAAQELGRKAAAINVALEQIAAAETPAAMVDALAPVLVMVAEHLDREADAVAIGTYGTRGIGVGDLSGREVFLRRGRGGPAELAEFELRGRIARLALSVSSSTYVACFYGEPALLTHPVRRRGADVGVVVASALFFRATSAASPKVGSGFFLALAPGIGIGVPILSDLAAVDIEARTVRNVPLADADGVRLEEALAAAPDRERFRRLARALEPKTDAPG